MLCPSRIDLIAPSATTSGTSVSHTPCARFTPPMRSHSCVIARISDCTTRGANSLNPSPRPNATSICPINPHSFASVYVILRLDAVTAPPPRHMTDHKATPHKRAQPEPCPPCTVDLTNLP